MTSRSCTLPRVVPVGAGTADRDCRQRQLPPGVETVIASGVGSKTVIARSEATKQSIVTVALAVDCFASLAMTEAQACPLHFSNSIAQQTRLRDLAARPARGLPRTSRLLKFRGRSECRAHDAPAASHAHETSTRA